MRDRAEKSIGGHAICRNSERFIIGVGKAGKVGKIKHTCFGINLKIFIYQIIEVPN